MKVEFYEKEIKGDVTKAVKLHIRKILQKEITQVIPEEVIIRPATEQDKIEFKTELDAFLAKRKNKKIKKQSS